MNTQRCSSTLISYYFLLLVLERRYSGIFVVVDLIAARTKEEGGQHVHGWENILLVVEKEVAADIASVELVENELIA